MSLDSRLRLARRNGTRAVLRDYEVGTVCEALQLLRACQRAERSEEGRAAMASIAERAIPQRGMVVRGVDVLPDAADPKAGLRKWLENAQALGCSAVQYVGTDRQVHTARVDADDATLNGLGDPI